jgi:glycosyltransferase involved in cell wall biosynthesis
MSRSVLIIQEHLPAFRVPFYEALRADLAGRGIDLKLVFASNQRNTFLKEPLNWAIDVPIRWWGPVGWQPVLGLARKTDLVIVQQETKYLVNPVLQILASLGGSPVAYWGHGKNFQAAGTGGLAAKVKKFLATKVHWWFAYNNLSARIVAKLGFSADRITSVGNAIDTTAMIERRKAVTMTELDALRTRLGLNSENIAVYTGGLYSNKRIRFLFEAARRIRRQIPDFHLLVVGDGPDRHLVSEAGLQDPWIHDIGPLGSLDKIPYWALSKVLLMPGGVGLVILDSFALGVPMVTTDTHLHGPEIDYLRNNVNGLLIPCGNDSERYAEEVSKLMLDPTALARLRDGAINSASEYSIERMVDNFTHGVMAALAAPRI